MDTFLKLLLIANLTGGEEGARQFVGGYVLGIVLLAMVVGRVS